MADTSELDAIVAANFDLLADSDDLNDIYLEDDVTEEDIEAVENIVTEAEAANNDEMEDSRDAFEEEDTNGRHAKANAEKLDFYADQNSKDTTKRQTKWAVKLFTGNCTLFIEIFFLKPKTKSCSRRQKGIPK